jgi:hypothetical protein
MTAWLKHYVSGVKADELLAVSQPNSSYRKNDLLLSSLDGAKDLLPT